MIILILEFEYLITLKDTFHTAYRPIVIYLADSTLHVTLNVTQIDAHKTVYR